MLLGHVTIPLIIYGFFPEIGLPKLQMIPLLWGAGVSNFDILPTFLRKETPEEPLNEKHGATVLHTPFFFIVTFFILEYFFGFVPALSFLIGGATHIALDSLDERGRMLLYPFSKKFYSIKIFPYDFWTYAISKKMLTIEGSLFIACCILLIF